MIRVRLQVPRWHLYAALLRHDVINLCPDYDEFVDRHYWWDESMTRMFTRTAGNVPHELFIRLTYAVPGNMHADYGTARQALRDFHRALRLLQEGE